MRAVNAALQRDFVQARNEPAGARHLPMSCHVA
jgi:hypothetical protein